MNAIPVLIVGGGAARCAVPASLKHRKPGLDIPMVEPSEQHSYHPAWTLVGGGAYDMARTEVPMAHVISRGVFWERAAVVSIRPDSNRVLRGDGRPRACRYLVVAAGPGLRWGCIEGLVDAQGRCGVTSNYRFDLAPSRWKLGSQLKQRRVSFTQPVMPIRRAGAPHKAMYLSCNAWDRHGLTQAIHVQFHNAGAKLFGVKEFVRPPMAYVRKYEAMRCFNPQLTAVDGSARARHGLRRRRPTAVSPAAAWISTCCTWCRRRPRPIACVKAGWAMRPDGSQ